MAISQRKTTIAVLRALMGPVYGREDRFAELAQRSVSWVKKVSAGIEPLTGDVAHALSLETGISPTWLLRGDPATAPVGSAGQLYNERAFQLHRAKLGKGKLEVQTVFDLAEIVAEITAIARSAAKQDIAAVFRWRLTEFLKASRDEFGCDERTQRQVQARAQDGHLPRLIFRDDLVDPKTLTRTSARDDASHLRPRKLRGSPKN